MKKTIFISLLFLSCIFTANAQWKQVLSGGYGGPIFTYRGNILCTTNDGIFLSTDTGKTWKVTDTNPNLKWVVMFAQKDSLLFGAEFDHSGIFVSADSGKSWIPTAAPLPFGGIQCIIFSGDTLLAGTDPDSMYISPDFGQHWIPSSKGLPREPLGSGISYLSFVNMGAGTIVFFGDATYITYDHGLSWRVKSKNCPPGFNVITIGANIYDAENASIVRSSDTTLNWTTALSEPSDFVSICTDNHYILAGHYESGVYISSDSGNNWAQITNGLSNNTTIGTAILGSYIFCSIYSGPGYVFRMPLAEALAVPETIKYTNGIKPMPSGLPSLSIYPDPVKHSATVDFGRQLQNGNLQLFNAQGQRVQQIDQISEAKIILQPNNLPAGAYTYILTEQGKATAAGKFIIQ